MGVRSPVYSFLVSVVVATAAIAVVHLAVPGLGTVGQFAVGLAAAILAGFGGDLIGRSRRLG
jgi:hypothetical protein